MIIIEVECIIQYDSSRFNYHFLGSTARHNPNQDKWTMIRYLKNGNLRKKLGLRINKLLKSWPR